VYHLSNPEDLNGNYVAASAGLPIAGGGDAVVLRNEHGVSTKLVGTTQGLRFNLAGRGVSVKLESSGLRSLLESAGFDSNLADREQALFVGGTSTNHPRGLSGSARVALTLRHYLTPTSPRIVRFSRRIKSLAPQGGQFASGH
jgi:hypothetical protein